MITKIVESFNHVNFQEYIKEVPLIAVYYSPTDYPGKYVARLWDGKRPTKIVVIRNSLSEIRADIPETFINIGREIWDDPVIVEVYV